MSWETSVKYLQLRGLVIGNITDPYETVTFFVGGQVEDGGSQPRWVWSGGEEVEEEAERCTEDYHVGDCLAIVWDEERACRSDRMFWKFSRNFRKKCFFIFFLVEIYLLLLMVIF